MSLNVHAFGYIQEGQRRKMVLAGYHSVNKRERVAQSHQLRQSDSLRDFQSFFPKLNSRMLLVHEVEVGRNVRAKLTWAVQYLETILLEVLRLALLIQISGIPKLCIANGFDSGPEA